MIIAVGRLEMCANSPAEGQYFYQVIPVSFEKAGLRSVKQGEEGALLPY